MALELPRPINPLEIQRPFSKEIVLGIKQRLLIDSQLILGIGYRERRNQGTAILFVTADLSLPVRRERLIRERGFSPISNPHGKISTIDLAFNPFDQTVFIGEKYSVAHRETTSRNVVFTVSSTAPIDSKNIYPHQEDYNKFLANFH